MAEAICTASPLLLSRPQRREGDVVSHPWTIIGSLTFLLKTVGMEVSSLHFQPALAATSFAPS